MVRSRMPKKPSSRPPKPEGVALKSNDDRLREVQAQTTAEAPLRDKLGRFVKRTPFVMHEPETPDGPRTVISSPTQKAAARKPAPVAAVALSQPYDHPLDQRVNGTEDLEVVEFVERVTPEVDESASSIAEVERDHWKSQFRRGLRLIIISLFLIITVSFFLTR